MCLLTEEQLSKRIDNSFYVDDGLPQEYPQSSSTKSEFGLIQKYLDGSIYIHAHCLITFKRDGGEIDAAQICSVFHGCPYIGSHRGLDDGSILSSDRHIGNAESFLNDDEHPVFVDIVELGDEIKRTAFSGKFPHIGSTVRLQSLDSCQRFSRNVLFEPFDRTSEIVPTHANGEKSGIACVGQRCSSKQSQLQHEVVKSAPQIVESIAYHQCPMEEMSARFFRELKAPPVRLKLHGERFTFSFRAPDIDCRCEVIEVLFRTVDFQAST